MALLACEGLKCWVAPSAPFRGAFLPMLQKQPEGFLRRVLRVSPRAITASRHAFGSQISAGTIPAFRLLLDDADDVRACSMGSSGEFRGRPGRRFSVDAIVVLDVSPFA